MRKVYVFTAMDSSEVRAFATRSAAYDAAKMYIADITDNSNFTSVEKAALFDELDKSVAQRIDDFWVEDILWVQAVELEGDENNG